MRIIVNGQQAFGKACLEAMVDRGDDVVAVYCAPDKEGRPADPVKDYALEKGLHLIQPANYKDSDVLDEMRALFLEPAATFYSSAISACELLGEMRALKSKRLREFNTKTKQMPKAERDKRRREFKAKVNAQYKEVSKRFPPARGLKDLKTVRDLISRIERVRMAS